MNPQEEKPEAWMLLCAEAREVRPVNIVGMGPGARAYYPLS